MNLRPFRPMVSMLPLMPFLLAAACRPVPSGDSGATGAAAPPSTDTAAGGGPASAPARPAWALAIHGGAGVIEKTMPEDVKAQYLTVLEGALAKGRDLLAGGATALDTVEAVVRFLEDDPHFNAGRGAVYTHDGRHELDAAIMDGRTLAAGAVTGVSTVKNPISLARLVMERSPHVLFAGAGAEAFATEMGVERVDASYFDTDRRFAQWQEAMEKERREALAKEAAGKETGTVGAVALDRDGNLAAATSTGGLTNKRWGRVGDSPIVGAGTYANNATVAVSGTGYGESFIRHTVAYDVSALVEYKGLSVEKAAEAVVFGRLAPGDGGLIAVGRDGSIALVFNSDGMFRGAADAGGRFEIKIWEE